MSLYHHIHLSQKPTQDLINAFETGDKRKDVSIAYWTGADWDVNAPDIKAIWQPGKEGIQSQFAEYTRYHNPWFMVKEWTRGHYKNDVYGYLSANFKINNLFDKNFPFLGIV